LIDSSISGDGFEPVLLAACDAVSFRVAVAASGLTREDVAAAAADADLDDVDANVALRVRVVAAAAGLSSSLLPALASAFFAEAAADFVDAARVLFLTFGTGVTSGPGTAAAVSDFFRGVLAGVAPAVLFVLIFFFGTLAAVVLLAALAVFATVEASREGCGVHVLMLGMHRAQRPRRCGLKTIEDIVRSGLKTQLEEFSIRNPRK
jgi:hypothetical protein